MFSVRPQFRSPEMVLLPHTAWAFARFESPSAGWLGISWGVVTAWAAAFAFEASFAVLIVAFIATRYQRPELAIFHLEVLACVTT